MERSCMICYEDLNNRSFGFNNCFPSHIFCIECVLETRKRSSQCPIDMLYFNDIVTNYYVSDDIEGVVKVEEGCIGAMKYIFEHSKHQEKFRIIIQEMKSSLSYLWEICFFCLDTLTGVKKYIFEYGTNNHQFCHQCSLQGFINYEKVNKSRRIRIEEVGIEEIYVDHVFIDTVQHWNTHFKKSELAQKMIDTLSCELNFCIHCSKNIEDKRQFGFDNCFSKHRFCERCALKCLTKSATVCSVDGLKSSYVIVEQAGVATETIHVEFFKIIKHLNEKASKNFFNNRIVSKLKKEMMITLKCPSDICIECFTDIKDEKQFSYESCCNRHLYCENCASEKMKSPRCSIGLITSSNKKVAQVGFPTEIISFGNYDFHKYQLQYTGFD